MNKTFTLSFYFCRVDMWCNESYNDSVIAYEIRYQLN
jgi:hypothetical protein